MAVQRMAARRATAAARTGISRDRLTVYLLLLGLLCVTAMLGRLGLGATRVLFVLGAVAVAYRAYQVGRLALHLEVVLTLFVLAPLLRRVVDLYAGYEANGIMLVAPLLALVVVMPELRSLLSSRTQSGTTLLPFLLMLACLVYGWSISAFEGSLLPATVTGLKYVLPLLYGMCLLQRPDQSEDVLQAAARTFLLLSPLIGLYGVWQHLHPQPWDTYWMTSSRMVSIGLPQPGLVRTFSTMNSPATFAVYATCGLLLIGLAPRTSLMPGWLVPLFAILPLSFALLLTEVRAAWIGASISVAVCLCFGRTRPRAALLAVCLGFGLALALLFTSVSDTLGDRLGSMTSGGEDGSGLERMRDYLYVFGEGRRYLFGAGLAGDNDPQMNALDGQLLMSAVQMGTTVGVLHALAVVWAGVQAVLRLGRDATPLRLVAGASILGTLSISLLNAIAFGEVGFLYWMLVGVLTIPAAGSAARLQPRPARV